MNRRLRTMVIAATVALAGTGLVVAAQPASATVYGYKFDAAAAADNSQVEIAVQLEKNGNYVRADAHVACFQDWDSHPCLWAQNWKVKLYKNGKLIHAVVANCGNHPGDWGTPDCPDWGNFNFTTAYMPWTSGTQWMAQLTHGDFAKADVNPGRGWTFYCEGEFGNPASSTQPCLQTQTFTI
jgi:hypothetical protein